MISSSIFNIYQIHFCDVLLMTDTIPLKMTVLPQGPWQKLRADFVGPFPDGSELLVVLDEYSRFPVVRKVTSTSNKKVCPVLDKIFSEYGEPIKLRTDGGSPFNSVKFQDFATHMGFCPRKCTPAWPQANGEVERFMTNLPKVTRTAMVEGGPRGKNVNQFLRNYRATPHATTGVTPQEMLSQRTMRIKLPEKPQSRRLNDKAVRKKDAEKIQEIKEYADSRRSVARKLTKGDMVLVKQQRVNKLMSLYDPRPLIVTSIEGSKITAQTQVKKCLQDYVESAQIILHDILHTVCR